MRTIYKIARTELRILFYSPIAWFLTIVFFVQCGLSYLNLLDYAVKNQEMAGVGVKVFTNLTSRIITGNGALFGDVMQKLYLYIPLLTMGLISKETNSGTIKLLHSSPIKITTIVLGKYLSMLMYNLLLVAVMGIFIVMGMLQIKAADGGMLLSAMLGLYLLLSAYTAIGLFMSCITSYQVVAALCTFVMIAILSYIGNVWQGIDFVRGLTYFLSISGRAEKMLSGLITTKDLIYFLLIIFLFIGFSVYALKVAVETKSFYAKMARYFAIVVTVLLIGYITSLPALTGYYDVTANKARTLTPNAQAIIKELGDAPLEVTVYNNLVSNLRYAGFPDGRNEDLRRWEPYMRFKENINLKYVQYYDSLPDFEDLSRQYPGKNLRQIAEQFAKGADLKMSLFKTPKEIRNIIDLRPEMNRYVMQLKFKDRTTFLRVFDDDQFWPGETEVSAALKRLLAAKLPKIGFITGDLERDINKIADKDYKTLTNLNSFRNSLVNQGFDVDTISLNDKEIPEDVTTLVIADPKIPLSTATMLRLQQYLNNGGNMLIAGEPGKQSILNPFLKQMGVQFNDGMVVQESKELSPDLVTANLTHFATTFSKGLAENATHTLPVSMPGVTGISYTSNSGFKVSPLLVTNSSLTWNKKQKLNLDIITSARQQVYDKKDIEAPSSVSTAPKDIAPAGTIVFLPDEGDEKGPVTTAISLTRNIKGKEQRIVISGDADFLSNNELQRYNIRTVNFSFNTALFGWLNYGAFPIDTSRPEAKDDHLYITSEEVGTLRIVLIWILPLLMSLFATVLLIRRKRK